MAEDAANPLEAELLELIKSLGSDATDASFSDGGEVDDAANEAHTSPSDAQKEAGNYQKGHVSVQGIPISIENARGTDRTGVGADGKPWSVKMPAHYGYIKRTEGADGDHVDVYVGPNPNSDKVYIIDQRDVDKGTFDEHKAMVGFDHPFHARDTYHAGFSDGRGPDRVGGVTHLSVADFKDWLKNGNTKKPLATKNVKSYAEGGTVERGAPQPDDSDIVWDEPAKTAAPDENGIVWDDKPEVSTGRAAYLAARRGAAPGLGGILAGAATGALVGGPAAPITSIIGGIAGGMGGGYAISKLQEHLWPISEEEQAGQEQHPYISPLAEMAPSALALGPGKGLQAVARVLSGGIMFGTDVGMQAAQTGTVDPLKALESAAFGAALPSANRLGRMAEGYGARGQAAIRQSLNAGRPDIKGTPESVAAKDDAANAAAPLTTARGVSVEQPRPKEDTTTIGNPESAPTRSSRIYKNEPTAGAPEAPSVTDGDIPPDIAAALKELFPDFKAAPEPAAAESVAPIQSGIMEAATGKPLPPNEPMVRPDPNRYLNRPMEPVGDIPPQSLARAKKTKTPVIAAEPAVNERRIAAEPLPEGVTERRSNGPTLPSAEERAVEMSKTVREAETKTNDKVKAQQLGEAFDEAKAIPPSEFADRPGTDVEPARIGKLEREVAPVTGTVTKYEIVDKAIYAAKQVGMKKLAATLEARGTPERAQEALDAIGKIATPPVERATVTGLDETAPRVRSEIHARNQSRQVEAVKSAFENFPPTDYKVPVSTADRLALEKRLKDAFDHAKVSNFNETPLKYKPRGRTAADMWLRAAVQLLKKGINPKRAAEFIALEKQLRSGNPEDIKNIRDTNRIEGDIARGRTSGEKAIAGAEAAKARELPSEDLVTHEEAEQWSKPVLLVPDEKGGLHPITHDQMAAENATLGENIVAAFGKREFVSKARQLEQEAAAERTGKLRRNREALELAKRTTAAAPVEPVSTPEKPIASEVRKVEITPELRAKYEGKEAIDAAVARARKPAVDVNAEEEALARPTDERTLPNFLNDKSGALNITALNAWMTKAAPKPYPSRATYTARRPKTDVQVKASKISDKLHQISQEHISDAVAIQQHAQSMPAALRVAKTQKDVYLALESKNIASLPTKVQEFVTKYLKPQMDETDRLYANISKIDPALIPPDRGYIHRIAVGHSPGLDVSSAAPIDPVTGVNSLHRSTSALQDRVFMAIESPTGNRAVISPSENGFLLWNKTKVHDIKAPGFEMKEGDTVKIGNTTFTVKQALTPEIEANALFKNGEPARYHQNAIFSVGDTLLKLREVARHLQFLDGLKTDPDFTAHATTNARIAAENGWKESILPEIHGRYQNQLSHVIKKFRGWYMDDQLRYVFNDYARAGLDTDSLDILRKANQAIVKTIFWNPVPHAANVFWHWWVGRGWDWITPQGYHSLAVDGMKAMKSVMSQDAFQKEMRDAGAGSIYGGVITRDWMRKFAASAGMDIQRNPSKWDPIARTLGVGPSDLVKAIYDGSSRTMWAVNDVLLTHQVMANMRKGMSMTDAIVHAERHIPNYRVPATIMGSGKYSRLASQLVQDPALITFGRYHYGVFNSLAHMTKDLAVGTGKERLEALGNVFALGLFIFAAKPALDALAKQITGNKDAEIRARGPASPILGVRDVMRGTKDISQVAGATVTVTPLMATIFNAARNKDWAGRDITERGDWRKLGQGSARAGARLVGQAAEHAARNLISPYGTLENTLDKKQSIAAGLRDQVLDISNPSQKSIVYKAKQPIKDLKAAKRREIKPRGILERIMPRS